MLTLARMLLLSLGFYFGDRGGLGDRTPHHDDGGHLLKAIYSLYAITSKVNDMKAHLIMALAQLPQLRKRDASHLGAQEDASSRNAPQVEATQCFKLISEGIDLTDSALEALGALFLDLACVESQRKHSDISPDAMMSEFKGAFDATTPSLGRVSSITKVIKQNLKDIRDAIRIECLDSLAHTS